MQCTLVPWNLSYSPDHHHHHLLGQQRPPGLAKGVLINDQTQELSPPRLPAAAGRSVWLPGAGGQGDHPGVRAHDGWGGGQIQDKISSLYSCGRTTTICQQMQCISPPPNCFGPAALQQSPWFLALTFIPLMCVFTQKMIISLSSDCYNTQRHSSVCRPLLSRHSVLPNIYCTVWNKVIWICPFIFPVYIGSEDELVCPQSSPARARDEVVMNAWQ